LEVNNNATHPLAHAHTPRACTTEANYWQTRSIVQPLCDSRATCL